MAFLRVAVTIILALTSFAVDAPSARAATGFLYDCDMAETDRGRGWISPKIALVFTADGKVTVIDAITLHFSKTPVIATVLRDNAHRLIVKWTVPRARADSGRSFSHFDYRASIAKASGRIDLTAIPRSYDVGLQGRGVCHKRTK